jgi:hypothetical protein
VAVALVEVIAGVEEAASDVGRTGGASEGVVVGTLVAVLVLVLVLVLVVEAGQMREPHSRSVGQQPPPSEAGQER